MTSPHPPSLPSTTLYAPVDVTRVRVGQRVRITEVEDGPPTIIIGTVTDTERGWVHLGGCHAVSFEDVLDCEVALPSSDAHEAVETMFARADGSAWTCASCAATITEPHPSVARARRDHVLWHARLNGYTTVDDDEPSSDPPTREHAPDDTARGDQGHAADAAGSQHTQDDAAAAACLCRRATAHGFALQDVSSACPRHGTGSRLGDLASELARTVLLDLGTGLGASLGAGTAAGPGTVDSADAGVRT